MRKENQVNIGIKAKKNSIITTIDKFFCKKKNLRISSSSYMMRKNYPTNLFTPTYIILLFYLVFIYLFFFCSLCTLYVLNILNFISFTIILFNFSSFYIIRFISHSIFWANRRRRSHKRKINVNVNIIDINVSCIQIFRGRIK